MLAALTGHIRVAPTCSHLLQSLLLRVPLQAAHLSEPQHMLVDPALSLNTPHNPTSAWTPATPVASGAEQRHNLRSTDTSAMGWTHGACQLSMQPCNTSQMPSLLQQEGRPPHPGLAAWPLRPSAWDHMHTLHVHHVRHMSSQLSRVRVPKSHAFNDTVVSNTTTLKHGMYGIRALNGKRVAANTIEAVRRTLRRRLKKTAALWVRIDATVPVTRKPEGIRMGKGKGVIEFYACAVRPGQIIFEMDRVPRKVAISALEAIQPKFPCKLAFVEWS